MGLYDMIMLKDNHITTVAGIEEAGPESVCFHVQKKPGLKNWDRNPMDDVKRVVDFGRDRIMFDRILQSPQIKVATTTDWRQVWTEIKGH